jgi:regulatory protein
LLARREHSRRELLHKLQLRFSDIDLIEETLNKLVDAGWLNEFRFVEAYIRSRAARGFGPMRIRQELLQRGIVDELIEEKLYNLSDINWQELAEQVRVKKFGEEKPKQYSERMKQLKFLHYRGFE